MSGRLAMVALCALVAGASQTADLEKPAFEAASIKLNQSHSDVRNGTRTSPGRLTIDNTPFLDVIEETYQLKGYQLAGFPHWLETDCYDVAATAKSASTRSQMVAMLQSLLEDRLRLKFHWTQGEVEGFALTVGKNGPKLQESREIQVGSNVRESWQIGKFSSPQATMIRLAEYLSMVLQVPVLDRTNLPGNYPVSLEYTRDAKVQSDSDFAPPPVSAALEEQLGLRLVKQKVPSRMFVIDRIERPSEN